MVSASEILATLDACCEAYTFPMLDNGYIYPAANRLSVYRSPDNWALVFEMFGFSPRAGLPDTTILTFAGRLWNRNRRDAYVSDEAHRNYLRHNPHNEDRRVWPLEPGDWVDAQDSELLSADATEFRLRGAPVRVPSGEAYTNCGIELSEPPRVMVFEFCRWLAAEHRQVVLASKEERRVSLESELGELLMLDDWHHPDLAGGERASQSETFQQLAKVLSTGDARHYRPSRAPNTHWNNWPDAGTL